MLLNKKVAQMLLERVAKFCAENHFWFWTCGSCCLPNLRLHPDASESDIGDCLLSDITFDFANQKVTAIFDGETLEAPYSV